MTLPDHSVDRLLAGRYALGSTLGAGGMGEVRTATDVRLGREVAVKLLRLDGADIDARRRFETEARAAARIAHPNAVAIYDFGEDTDTAYLVMELLPARTVAEEIADGPLEESRARRFAAEMLNALATAHDVGVIHRDIKPQNVLLTADDHVKVGDFGIAKIAEAGDATRTGMLLGTPAYLAPERLGGGSATPRSDIYSVGVVLYEMLTGRKAFSGEAPIAVANAVQRGAVAPLRKVRRGVDPALVAVVERAMARDPKRRYASARAMAAALRGSDTTQADTVVSSSPALGGDATLALPVDATQTLRSPKPSRMTTRERRDRPRARPSRVASLIALCVLVVAVVAGVLIAGASDQMSPGSTTTSTSVVVPSPGVVVNGSTLPRAVERDLRELERLVRR